MTASPPAFPTRRRGHPTAASLAAALLGGLPPPFSRTRAGGGEGVAVPTSVRLTCGHRLIICLISAAQSPQPAPGRKCSSSGCPRDLSLPDGRAGGRMDGRTDGRLRQLRGTGQSDLRAPRCCGTPQDAATALPADPLRLEVGLSFGSTCRRCLFAPITGSRFLSAQTLRSALEGRLPECRQMRTVTSAPPPPRCRRPSSHKTVPEPQLCTADPLSVPISWPFSEVQRRAVRPHADSVLGSSPSAVCEVAPPTLLHGPLSTSPLSSTEQCPITCTRHFVSAPPTR